MTAKAPKEKKKKADTNTYHWYTPRFWLGMSPKVWFGLLWQHRFALTRPEGVGMSISSTLFSPLNTIGRWIQESFLRRRIAESEIKQPPVFILGHWRSGTTYLHELLIMDPNHGYATTYQCMAPNHFLATSWLLPKLTWFLLPRKRPMDNVAMGWDRPQEDEFALMNLGAPSPYRTMAFPNHPPDSQHYLDFAGVSDEDRGRWKATLMWFLKRLNVADPRRIVLKSPPHTGRIKTLLEMFPDAKFVHIARDPHVLFPSTVRLWKSLWEAQALQKPKHDGLEEFVFESFERMYGAYQDQVDLIDPANLCEVHYEELAVDPLGQLEHIYKQLDLGEFGEVRQTFEDYLAGQDEYKKNTYELEPKWRDEIARRWGWYLERYGYRENASGPHPSGRG